MAKLSKRMVAMRSVVDFSKQYEILEGISVLKKLSTVNFIESFDVVICLGIDSRKSEQNVHGSVCLPHGTGRNYRIVVFTQGINVSLARDAGADLVGLNDLFDYVKNKKNKFDVVIATPDVMQVVSQLGSVLGPRGLMPNPKYGTVTQNVVDSIKKIRMGHIFYKNDKYGIIHASIGRLSFRSDQLKENLEALIVDVKKNKPAQSKGIYLEKIVISSTMGSGILIDETTLFSLGEKR